jgi:hypothetical protein
MSKPETLSQLEALIATAFPNGSLETDLDGQLIIYTGLSFKRDSDGAFLEDYEAGE